jgi:decaprenylphospho-beta-D-ribofuranose 2-oxidase
VRAFNALYHRWAAVGEGLQAIESFFYPLDRVREWNRLYGRAGFLQYQLVVPLGQEAALRRMVEQLARARVPSYLSVLKRLGPGRGPMAFPMHGWTLTLDIPAAAPGADAALDRLDEAVAACGGRVYLAKDARLRPDLVAAMYPQIARWRAARARLDPAGHMRSDLARRLELVDGRR